MKLFATIIVVILDGILRPIDQQNYMDGQIYACLMMSALHSMCFFVEHD